MTLNASGIGYTTYDVQGAMATGGYTGDGSGSIAVAVGFTPKYVKIWDMTDATTWEWCQGMAATDSVKVVTAGTMTVDTNTAVATNGKLFTQSSVGTYQPPGGAGDGTIINSGNISVFGTDSTNANQLVIGSTCNTNAKVYVWMALGG